MILFIRTIISRCPSRIRDGPFQGTAPPQVLPSRNRLAIKCLNAANELQPRAFSDHASLRNGL
jgi:hypothetical protein